jgi:hypothetical protein
MLPRMMSTLARQHCRLVPAATLSSLQPLRSRQQQQQHTKHSAYYTSIAAVAASVGTVAAFSSTSLCEGNAPAEDADEVSQNTTEGDAVDMQSNIAVPEGSLRKLYPPIEPYNSGHLQVTHKLTNAILQVKDLVSAQG